MASRYDLLPRMSGFLDPHLVQPVVDFYESVGLYSGGALREARLSVLLRSNAVEEARAAWDAAFGAGAEAPAALVRAKEAFEARVATLGERRKRLAAGAKPVIEALDAATREMEEEEAGTGHGEAGAGEGGEAGAAGPAKTEEEREERLFALLQKRGVGLEQLDVLCAHAKVLFEDGDYESSARLLYYYLTAVRGAGGDPERELRGRWGKLACEVLLGEYEEASGDVEKLSHTISERFPGEESGDVAKEVQQRAWLAHWALYCAFGMGKGGRALVLQLLATDSGLQMCQVLCPWLLRYVVAVVIASSSPRDLLMRVARTVRAVREEVEDDPLCMFLVQLTLDMDDEAARDSLAQCKTVIENDFFLSFPSTSSTSTTTTPTPTTSTSSPSPSPSPMGMPANDFMEPARRMLFQTYCRLHRNVHIATLAEHLGLRVSDAERWAVDMMRSAHLEGRIDAAGGVVAIGAASTSIHQEIIERTKDLHLRTAQLHAHLASQIKASKKATRRA